MSRLRLFWRLFLAGGLFILLGAAALLRWGGYLLVAADPLPQPVEALVVPAGSWEAEEARRTEAIRLLREGRGDYVLLSVQDVWYLGQWEPDVLRRYLVRKYTEKDMQRIVFCSTRADSTKEEAQALQLCLGKRGWRSALIVTSNYHTRRAGIIWHRLIKDANPPLHISIHGVWDGDFEADGWWRKRRYAKTFVLEAAKLAWTCLFE